MKEIYLDNNASSRPLPEVVAAVSEALGRAGNPSSPHGAGRVAREIIESSRRDVASFVGADPEGLIFTSSGTEANNMALLSIADGRGRARVVTTSVEHSSVLKMCSRLEITGAEVVRVGVDGSGIVDMEELEKQIAAGADMVSVQWVNNETGVIQDTALVAEMCRKSGAAFHTDAAQTPGKIPVDTAALGADFVTFTGHKFNAPQGCGAIAAKDRLGLSQMMFGGFQEGGFRPGTENVAGIAGMGAAARTRGKTAGADMERTRAMRDAFEEKVLETVPGATVNGAGANRAPNTASIAFRGADGAKMTAVLDSLGLRCSQGSACTAFDPSPSYVLTAMGLSREDAASSIRFSFGVDNPDDDALLAAEMVARARAASAR